jgi:hypothetical protein
MQAITVRDRDAGVGGLSLTDMPSPPGLRERRDRAGARRGVHSRRAGLADNMGRPHRASQVGFRGVTDKSSSAGVATQTGLRILTPLVACLVEGKTGVRVVVEVWVLVLVVAGVARSALRRPENAPTCNRLVVERGVCWRLGGSAGGEAAHLLGSLEGVLIGVRVLEDQRQRLDR